MSDAKQLVSIDWGTLVKDPEAPKHANHSVFAIVGRMAPVTGKQAKTHIRTFPCLHCEDNVQRRLKCGCWKDTFTKQEFECLSFDTSLEIVPLSFAKTRKRRYWKRM